MSLIKKISLALLAVLVVIQFFRIDKTNPEVDPATNMLNLVDTSSEVEKVLKTACYDCHSFETTYPWYTNIAPVSWLVKGHINEGREELNFSAWGSYSAKRQDHKLEEIGEKVGEGDMPLTSYLILHDEARIDEAQRQAIVSWAKAVRKNLGYTGGSDDDDEEHEENEEN